MHICCLLIITISMGISLKLDETMKGMKWTRKSRISSAYLLVYPEISPLLVTLCGHFNKISLHKYLKLTLILMQ